MRPVPRSDGSLLAREFLFLCEELALARFDPVAAGLQRRVMWTILQYYATRPWVHVELQPQLSRGIVELGLHFEGTLEANEAAAMRFARRPEAVLSRLGDRWDFEVWTASWRRYHRAFPFERLDRELARGVAADLAALLEAGAELLPELERAGEPHQQAGPRRRGRRGRPRPRR